MCDEVSKSAYEGGSVRGSMCECVLGSECGACEVGSECLSVNVCEGVRV